MSDELPRRRTLESLKKEAKRWLDELRQESPAARRRLDQAVARAIAAPTLRDVQYALAREHGFPGWNDLRRHVESLTPEPGTTLRQYEQMARSFQMPSRLRIRNSPPIPGVLTIGDQKNKPNGDDERYLVAADDEDAKQRADDEIQPSSAVVST